MTLINLLYNIFDRWVINEIRKRVEVFDSMVTDPDKILSVFQEYIKAHYEIHEYDMTPKISNYYKKHKKFTRFLLICISIFGTDDEQFNLSEYNFNEPLKWEVEHLVPQSQSHNKFSKTNAKLKNRLGNLTLLSKEINNSISNKSFYKKREHIKKCASEQFNLKVNEVFNKKFEKEKTNLSKNDIRNREKELNHLIFDIFFKDGGQKFKDKLKKISFV